MGSNESFFSALIRRRIQRSRFHSIVSLQAVRLPQFVLLLQRLHPFPFIAR
jgi:hypothetical protein